MKELNDEDMQDVEGGAGTTYKIKNVLQKAHYFYPQGMFDVSGNTLKYKNTDRSAKKLLNGGERFTIQGFVEKKLGNTSMILVRMNGILGFISKSVYNTATKV